MLKEGDKQLYNLRDSYFEFQMDAVTPPYLKGFDIKPTRFVNLANLISVV